MRKNFEIKFGGWQRSSLIDFPSKISVVLFTVGCPFRCPFCHNPSLVLPEKFEQGLPIEEVQAFLEKRRGVLDGVVISGGEPTIHAGLPDFLRYVKDLGFSTKVDTNGVYPEVIQQLMDAALVDYWAMDVKTSMAAYRDVAHVPVPTAAIQRSIFLLLHGGSDYEFRTTVVRGIHTADDCEQMAREVAGAKRYILQRFQKGETIDPSMKDVEPHSDAEMDAFCERVRPHVRECWWR